MAIGCSANDTGAGSGGHAVLGGEAEASAMEMKVVGGPHDGEFLEPDGNSITLYRAIQGSVESPHGLVAGHVEKVVYTVRHLASKFPDGTLDRFCFLAPHWMTDMEAIRHQFQK